MFSCLFVDLRSALLYGSGTSSLEPAAALFCGWSRFIGSGTSFSEPAAALSRGCYFLYAALFVMASLLMWLPLGRCMYQPTPAVIFCLDVVLAHAGSGTSSLEPAAALFSWLQYSSVVIFAVSIRWERYEFCGACCRPSCGILGCHFLVLSCTVLPHSSCVSLCLFSFAAAASFLAAPVAACSSLFCYFVLWLPWLGVQRAFYGGGCVRLLRCLYLSCLG